MASTSSAAPIHHKYDVFLSFRGQDTRYSFTDNLYHALKQAGIKTFRDDDEIRGGQELKPDIERSITESKASVIVFSKNFANSSWCLDELWLILQQRRNAGHFVLPVFIKVDPSDVRNQRGSFTIAAQEGLKWTEDNVKRWKEALTEVADLKGMVLSGYEKDFIAKIVDQVRHRLGLHIRSPPASLTGIETRAGRVISWLRSDQPDHPVLAICGMGGSGKTTFAKHIYYSNKQNFEGCCLVEEIEKQPDGLLGVQNKLLRDISGSNSMMISDVYEGALQLMKVIKMKRVLIVVDDIDDRDKLSSLFGTNVFHTKSKIIITTRILNIDTWFESVSFRCHVYQLELLNLGESLELLCWHAFGSKVPMEGFENFAAQLAQYCGGNPLALKVSGSSLFVGTEKPWSMNNLLEIWRGRMNKLNSLKGDFEHNIRGVLQRSFESLPCHSHKELFLHIGCFFVGNYRYEVEKVLEDDYHASYGIMTLINRCLVTVSSDGKLMMHQLLQDMARNIVHEESKDPTKRSRIWHHDEACRLLSKGDGSDTIEGLILDMREGKQEMTSETFKTSFLVKMKNLKFLFLDSVNLTGSYENFPDLRWLIWHKSNIKTIPPGLLMSSLVAIYLTFGDFEKFEPPKVLYSLKILDLSWSPKLVSICNLNRLPKLVSLNLGYCTSLTHVCEIIGDLNNLSLLGLQGCTKLWKDSSNQKFKNPLERIKALFIWGGIPQPPLSSLPRSLSCLNLSNSLFNILPNHIDLKALQTLVLEYCSNLKSLPCLPSTLKDLHVDWCKSLERIAFQTSRFTLQKFTYEGCNKLCEIEGLFKLVSVSEVDEADLEPMQWIKAYQNHKVDLIGDVITKDRTFNTQMLYEYGIRSTYVQGIEDQSMMTYEYMSSSNMLSFCVPMHPKKNRIQGLNVTILYISSGADDRGMLPWFIRICNGTKGLSWVYNPVVFCKPRSVETDVVWLSYWPIGNILDVGDEVHVAISLLDNCFTVRECGASIVYMDDVNVEKEEKSEQMKGEEVIGGDLSSFQVSKGAYYLCRCDLFQSWTPDELKVCFDDNKLKWLFGNNIESTSTTDTEGWRMRRGSGAQIVYPYATSFQNTDRAKIEVEYSITNFDSESETKMIENAVSSVEGVESVIIHNEIGRLLVCGCFNPQAVIKCVTQFEKMAHIIYYIYV